MASKSRLPEYRDHTGEIRKLGHVVPPGGPRRLVSAAPMRVVPKEAWLEFEIPESACPWRVKNQGSFGACNGFAAMTSEEIARWVAGLPHDDLSPWFIYAILCNGVDRGSIISDALDLLRSKGTCPEEMVPSGTINPNRLTQQARENAGRFRIEIGEMIRTADELMSAVQLRQPFNFSVCVAGGFDQLDSDGCVRLGSGYDNHAVTGTATGAKRCRDGTWAFKWQNSWGTQWGLGGYAWMRMDRVARNPYFEAYSIRAVTEDPQDADQPPKVTR